MTGAAALRIPRASGRSAYTTTTPESCSRPLSSRTGWPAASTWSSRIRRGTTSGGARDEWTVWPDGSGTPATLNNTFLIRGLADCDELDHVDDGIPVRVASRSQTTSRGVYELRVTEDRLAANTPAGTPVSCLGDRLMDARQAADMWPGAFDPSRERDLQIHPHTPWWNALVRIFNLAPSGGVGRMWLQDRACQLIDGRSATVLVFRYVACEPS